MIYLKLNTMEAEVKLASSKTRIHQGDQKNARTERNKVPGQAYAVATPPCFQKHVDYLSSDNRWYYTHVFRQRHYRATASLICYTTKEQDSGDEGS